MVTVKDIKKMENSKGEEFFGLLVESGAMPVKSKQTGRIYLTTKKAFIPCTFDRETATSLIGSEFPGIIKKVPTEPYEYTIEETGEVIELSHKWEYVDPDLDMQEVVEKQVVKEAILL